MSKFDGENPELSIIKVNNATGKCVICGAETRFADIDYQYWVCSTECQIKMSERKEPN